MTTQVVWQIHTLSTLQQVSDTYLGDKEVLETFVREKVTIDSEGGRNIELAGYTFLLKSVGQFLPFANYAQFGNTPLAGQYQLEGSQTWYYSHLPYGFSEVGSGQNLITHNVVQYDYGLNNTTILNNFTVKYYSQVIQATYVDLVSETGPNNLNFEVLKKAPDSHSLDASSQVDTITLPTSLAKYQEWEFDKYTLRAGAGDDVLNATMSPGSVRLSGGEGSDTIDGSNFRDYLDGTRVRFELPADWKNFDAIQFITDISENGADPGDPGNPSDAAFTNTIRGGGGDDFILGGHGVDFLQGDSGADLILGYGGDDTLFGGIGNDLIDGGHNVDAALAEKLPTLLGTFEKDTAKYEFAYVPGTTVFQQGEPITQLDDRPVNVFTRGGETDMLRNVEFAEFTNGKVPLFNWSFEVTRSDLGKAVVKFFENGVLLKQYNNCFFDSALPVSPGEYDADIRARPNGTFRIELTDGSTGVSSVAGRTAIQLHTGTYEQHSEGCIVFPQFTSEVMKHIMDRIGTQSLLLKTLSDGRQFLDLPIDIKVSFLDSIEQTKLTFGTDDPRVREGTTTSFSLKVDETAGFDNKVSQVFDVTFAISGTATYGVDYIIRDELGNAVSVSGGKFTSRLNSNDSAMDFTFVALADSDSVLEYCRLSIADIDIRHDATKAFDPYSVSTNLAAFSLQERLLLPLAADEKFIDITVLA